MLQKRENFSKICRMVVPGWTGLGRGSWRCAVMLHQNKAMEEILELEGEGF